MSISLTVDGNLTDLSIKRTFTVKMLRRKSMRHGKRWARTVCDSNDKQCTYSWHTWKWLNGACPHRSDGSNSRSVGVKVRFDKRSCKSGWKVWRRVPCSGGGSTPLTLSGMFSLSFLFMFHRRSRWLTQYQNLLRKGLYYNYDYYHAQGEVEFSDSDWAQRLHVCKSSSSRTRVKISVARYSRGSQLTVSTSYANASCALWTSESLARCGSATTRIYVPLSTLIPSTYVGTLMTSEPGPKWGRSQKILRTIS